MENLPTSPPVNSTLKNVVIISIAITAIVLLCTLPRACNRGNQANERGNKGVSAAKAAVRYLNDLRDLSDDPPAFDKKWRWAWQEIDAAEKEGFDKDITEKLRCAHAAFAVELFTDELRQASGCLSEAESLLNMRYPRR